ncbi:AzlC family ABC transporter permease [Alkaliphilus crotonatoxidans]
MGKTIDRPIVLNEFKAGAIDSIPLLIGAVPFGITCGIMGITVGLKPLETIMMSAIVFAGSAQFTAITMLGAGITGGLIVATTLLLNLRHLLMGFSLAPHMEKLPVPLQSLLAFLMTDEAFAVVSSRIMSHGYNSHYHLGVGLSLYGTWFAATALGVSLGAYIPNPLDWGLDFAMPATFLVLLLPLLSDRNNRIICIVAAITAVITALYLPGKWYIIITCLLSCLVGGLLTKGDEKNAL